MSLDANSPEFASNQIARYKGLQRHFRTYTKTLREILEQAALRHAPFAITAAREKEIASFAEKIQRKKTKYNDPVNQFTDLCGARVITYTEDEKKAICRFVRDHFTIDWANSEDEMYRLGKEKFGYRSTHFIVQFKPKTFPNAEIKVRVPPELFPFPAHAPGNPMKAEIQVRTLLEHAWASFTHDRAYKAGFTPPPSLTRELNVVSAVLESADSSFTRALASLRLYGESYAYFSAAQTQNEVNLLQAALAAEPSFSKRANVALRIARLARSACLWDSVISTLDPIVPRLGRRNSGQANALRLELGHALARKHEAGRESSAEFLRGQELLKTAAGLAEMKLPLPQLDSTPENRIAAGASALLGWSHSQDASKRQLVAALYLRALEGQLDNPYYLVDHLIHELAWRGRGHWRHLLTMQSALVRAVEICHEHIRVQVGRPRVYFALGFLHLFLAKQRDLGDAAQRQASAKQRNDLYAGLAAMARGIQASEGLEPIREASKAVGLLQSAVSEPHGEITWESRLLDWACRLLRCGEVAKLHTLAAAADADLSAAQDRLSKNRKNVRKAGNSGTSSERKFFRQENGKIQQQIAQAREKTRQLTGDLQNATERMRVDFLSRAFHSSECQLRSPILIVGDGTAEDVEDGMRGYAEALRATLAGFMGTIFSGGTRAGIPGILGEIASQSAKENRFCLMAYLPNSRPAHVLEDERYDQPFIRTDDHDFSPAQPLQNWADILAHGIPPAAVTVLGINGGPVAEFEYRLGLGLGARTALLRQSGRAADHVLEDDDLAGDPNLIAIPDAMTLQNFITPPPRTSFRQQLGRRIHQNYLAQQGRLRLENEPNFAAWPKLPPSLRESNFQQADAVDQMLRSIRCRIVKAPAGGGRPVEFTPEEIETLAEMEHSRWNAERLREGWRYAPEKNVEKKLTPYLVAWTDLSEPIREWDRSAVSAWPDLLAARGLRIVRRK